MSPRLNVVYGALVVLMLHIDEAKHFLVLRLLFFQEPNVPMVCLPSRLGETVQIVAQDVEHLAPRLDPQVDMRVFSSSPRAFAPPLPRAVVGIGAHGAVRFSSPGTTLPTWRTHLLDFPGRLFFRNFLQHITGQVVHAQILEGGATCAGPPWSLPTTRLPLEDERRIMGAYNSPPAAGGTTPDEEGAAVAV